MASVTITIPSADIGIASVLGVSAVFSNLQSGSYIPLGNSLSANGGDQFLGNWRLFRSVPPIGHNLVRIEIADSQTADDSTNGPDFSEQMEMSGTIIFMASSGASVTITGISDSTEPYNWNPSNASEIYAFANTLAGLSDRSLTIIFNDNADTTPSFADDTGDDQSWTVGVPITDIIVPEAMGSPTPTYAVVGALPSGIDFDVSTRVISGTPSVAGSGTITIRATNSEGSDDWTVDYLIDPPPLQQLGMAGRAGNPTAIFDLIAVAPLQQLVMSANAGDPTVGFDVSVVRPLALADFNQFGLTFLVGPALIVPDNTNQGGNFNYLLYSSNSHGGSPADSGTLIDGSLGFTQGGEQGTISRIAFQDTRTNNENRVVFNRTGAGSLEDLNNDNSDAIVYFQTASELWMWDLGDAISDGDSFIAWRIKTSDSDNPINPIGGSGTDLYDFLRTVFDNNTPFLLAVANGVQGELLEVRATAGIPVAEFGLSVLQPQDVISLVGSATSGNPTAQGTLRVTNRVAEELAFTARAGNPSAEFSLEAISGSIFLIGSASAGSPTAQGILRVITLTPAELGVVARAGSPTAVFDVTVVSDEPEQLGIEARAGLPTVQFNLVTDSVIVVDVAGLSSGTTYYARVLARNDEGEGPWSSVRSFTTETEVGRVVLLDQVGREVWVLSTGVADPTALAGSAVAGVPTAQGELTVDGAVIGHSGQLVVLDAADRQVWVLGAGAADPDQLIGSASTGAPTASGLLTIDGVIAPTGKLVALDSAGREVWTLAPMAVHLPSGLAGSATTGDPTAQGRLSVDGMAASVGKLVLLDAADREVWSLAAASDVRLLTLSITPGVLAPNFDPSTQLYSVQVANNVMEVEVVATAGVGSSIVRGVGMYSLRVGYTTLTVLVIGADGISQWAVDIVVERVKGALDNGVNHLVARRVETGVRLQAADGVASMGQLVMLDWAGRQVWTLGEAVAQPVAEVRQRVGLAAGEPVYVEGVVQLEQLQGQGRMGVGLRYYDLQGVEVGVAQRASETGVLATPTELYVLGVVPTGAVSVEAFGFAERDMAGSSVQGIVAGMRLETGHIRVPLQDRFIVGSSKVDGVRPVISVPSTAGQLVTLEASGRGVWIVSAR